MVHRKWIKFCNHNVFIDGRPWNNFEAVWNLSSLIPLVSRQNHVISRDIFRKKNPNNIKGSLRYLKFAFVYPVDLGVKLVGRTCPCKTGSQGKEYLYMLTYTLHILICLYAPILQVCFRLWMLLYEAFLDRKYFSRSSFVRSITIKKPVLKHLALQVCFHVFVAQVGVCAVMGWDWSVVGHASCDFQEAWFATWGI